MLGIEGRRVNGPSSWRIPSGQLAINPHSTQNAHIQAKKRRKLALWPVSGSYAHAASGVMKKEPPKDRAALVFRLRFGKRELLLQSTTYNRIGIRLNG